MKWFVIQIKFLQRSHKINVFCLTTINQLQTDYLHIVSFFISKPLHNQKIISTFVPNI